MNDKLLRLLLKIMKAGTPVELQKRGENYYIATTSYMFKIPKENMYLNPDLFNVVPGSIIIDNMLSGEGDFVLMYCALKTSTDGKKCDQHIYKSSNVKKEVEEAIFNREYINALGSICDVITFNVENKVACFEKENKKTGASESVMWLKAESYTKYQEVE